MLVVKRDSRDDAVYPGDKVEIQIAPDHATDAKFEGQVMANSGQDRPKDCHEAGNPLHRIHLSDNVRGILARNVRVTVDVCATGEPCAQVRRCGNEAHVRVIIHDIRRDSRALCADHWLALQEIYAAISNNRLHYGPGARNIINMRRRPHPSDSLGQTKKQFGKESD